MATELETLVVTLEASIKQYERQLARAQGVAVKTMRDIERSVESGGRGISSRFGLVGMQAGKGFTEGFKRSLGGIGRGLLAGAIGGFGFNAVRAAIQKAGDIGDTARDLGLSTDALQTFQKAMQLAGGSTEDLNKMIANMQSELEDSGSVLSDFVKRANLDPAKMSVEELFRAILKLAEAMPAEDRMRLFREGFKLKTNIALEAGEMATHLEEAAQAARLSADQIAKLDKLGESMTAAFEEAGVLFADFLADMSNTDDAEDAIKALVGFWGDLLDIVKTVTQAIQTAMQTIESYAIRSGQMANIGLKSVPVLGDIVRGVEALRHFKDEIFGKGGGDIGDVGKELGASAKDAIDPEDIGERIGRKIVQLLQGANLGLGYQTGAGEAAGFMGVVPGAGMTGAKTVQMGSVMAALMGGGIGRTTAAAIVGNLMRESGLNPNARGTAGEIGIAQWRLERRQQLQAFAASQGKPETDFGVQLQFLIQELKGARGQRALAAMQGKSLPEQVEAFMRIFEAPKAGPGAALGQRIGYASVAYEGAKGLKEPVVPKTAAELAAEAKAYKDSEDAINELTKAYQDRQTALKDWITTQELERQLQIATHEGDTAKIADIKAEIQARQMGISVKSKEYDQIRAQISANEELTQSYEQQKAAQEELQQIGSALESATTNFVDALLEGKSASEALHNALKSLASDLLHMAIHQIFSSLFPAPGATGGGGLGSLFGFQHGGQFRVGGSGGTDSSLVAFRATPGEMVSVTPRHLAGGRGHGGIAIGGTVINVAGNADERTVEMIDRRIAANNYRSRKQLERDWGAMSMRYQQLRG